MSEENQTEKRLVSAIKKLRSQKLRADDDKLCRILLMEHGVSKGDVLHHLQECINRGIIIESLTRGNKISYHVPNENEDGESSSQTSEQESNRNNSDKPDDGKQQIFKVIYNYKMRCGESEDLEENQEKKNSINEAFSSENDENNDGNNGCQPNQISEFLKSNASRNEQSLNVYDNSLKKELIKINSKNDSYCEMNGQREDNCCQDEQQNTKFKQYLLEKIISFGDDIIKGSKQNKDTSEKEAKSTGNHCNTNGNTSVDQTNSLNEKKPPQFDLCIENTNQKSVIVKEKEDIGVKNTDIDNENCSSVENETSSNDNDTMNMVSAIQMQNIEQDVATSSISKSELSIIQDEANIQCTTASENTDNRTTIIGETNGQKLADMNQNNIKGDKKILETPDSSQTSSQADCQNSNVDNQNSSNGISEDNVSDNANINSTPVNSEERVAISIPREVEKLVLKSIFKVKKMKQSQNQHRILSHLKLHHGIEYEDGISYLQACVSNGKVIKRTTLQGNICFYDPKCLPKVFRKELKQDDEDCKYQNETSKISATEKEMQFTQTSKNKNQKINIVNENAEKFNMLNPRRAQNKINHVEKKLNKLKKPSVKSRRQIRDVIKFIQLQREVQKEEAICEILYNWYGISKQKSVEHLNECVENGMLIKKITKLGNTSYQLKKYVPGSKVSKKTNLNHSTIDKKSLRVQIDFKNSKNASKPQETASKGKVSENLKRKYNKNNIQQKKTKTAKRFKANDQLLSKEKRESSTKVNHTKSRDIPFELLQDSSFPGLIDQAMNIIKNQKQSTSEDRLCRMLYHRYGIEQVAGLQYLQRCFTEGFLSKRLNSKGMLVYNKTEKLLSKGAAVNSQTKDENIKCQVTKTPTSPFHRACKPKYSFKESRTNKRSIEKASNIDLKKIKRIDLENTSPKKKFPETKEFEIRLFRTDADTMSLNSSICGDTSKDHFNSSTHRDYAGGSGSSSEDIDKQLEVIDIDNEEATPETPSKQTSTPIEKDSDMSSSHFHIEPGMFGNAQNQTNTQQQKIRTDNDSATKQNTSLQVLAEKLYKVRNNRKPIDLPSLQVSWVEAAVIKLKQQRQETSEERICNLLNAKHCMTRDDCLESLRRCVKNGILTKVENANEIVYVTDKNCETRTPSVIKIVPNANWKYDSLTSKQAPLNLDQCFDRGIVRKIESRGALPHSTDSMASEILGSVETPLCDEQSLQQNNSVRDKPLKRAHVEPPTHSHNHPNNNNLNFQQSGRNSSTPNTPSDVTSENMFHHFNSSIEIHSDEYMPANGQHGVCSPVLSHNNHIFTDHVNTNEMRKISTNNSYSQVSLTSSVVLKAIERIELQGEIPFEENILHVLLTHFNVENEKGIEYLKICVNEGLTRSAYYRKHLSNSIKYPS